MDLFSTLLFPDISTFRLFFYPLCRLSHILPLFISRQYKIQFHVFILCKTRVLHRSSSSLFFQGIFSHHRNQLNTAERKRERGYEKERGFYEYHYIVYRRVSGHAGAVGSVKCQVNGNAIHQQSSQKSYFLPSQSPLDIFSGFHDTHTHNYV